MTYTHDDYLRDKKAAMDFYKGDEEKYKADHKRTVGVGIMWSDIEAYAAVYPEHRQRALEEIGKRLGYTPHDNIIIPHEVFIRTLIEQFDNGLISETDYERDITTHVKHIRNDDINKFGWADKLRYTWAEIEHYNNFLPQYEAMAHEKITRYFGELPPLDYILPADMLLRKTWNQHPDIITYGFTPIDYKAFTIIAYRKVVINEGIVAADQLPPIFLRLLTLDFSLV